MSKKVPDGYRIYQKIQIIVDYFRHGIFQQPRQSTTLFKNLARMFENVSESFRPFVMFKNALELSRMFQNIFDMYIYIHIYYIFDVLDFVLLAIDFEVF